VVALDAQVDVKTFEFSVPVTVIVDATRFGVKVVELEPGADLATVRRKLLENFVAHGARAQLRSGSLLTGAMYVAIDFFPDASAVTMDWSRKPVEFPTVPGELEGIEASITKIVKKLDTVPIQAIGDDLKKAIVHLDETLVSARGTFDSATRLVAPDSTWTPSSTPRCRSSAGRPAVCACSPTTSSAIRRRSSAASRGRRS